MLTIDVKEISRVTIGARRRGFISSCPQLSCVSMEDAEEKGNSSVSALLWCGQNCIDICHSLPPGF